jgi:hypothetical protein
VSDSPSQPSPPSDGKPPRIATWLLLHLVGGRYAESLAGDLIEEYQGGRSGVWYWKQVLIAILMPRADILGAAGRWLIELAVVLGLVTIDNRARHVCALSDLFTPSLLGLLVGLSFLGWLGWRASFGAPAAHVPGGARQSSARRFMSAAAVIAVGWGSLTWASVASREDCRVAACHCAAETAAHASAREHP